MQVFNRVDLAESTTDDTKTHSPLKITLSVSDQATAGSFAVMVTNPAPGRGASNSATVTVAHTVTCVSSTQLKISLSTSDLATGGTYTVVVSNPAPGRGPSNSVYFTVNQ